MAVVRSILRLTAQDVVVKIQGTAAANTINLNDADIIPTTQTTDGATQTVNIVGLVWTGAANGIVTITRNSVVIYTLQANAAGFLDFSGQGMVPDTVNNTYPVVITMSGAQAECWIRLRKVAGYKTLYEPATYGSYDDITRFGASETVSGSPDKV